MVGIGRVGSRNAPVGGVGRATAIFALGGLGLLWRFVLVPMGRVCRGGPQARFHLAMSVLAGLAIVAVFVAMILAMGTADPNR